MKRSATAALAAAALALAACGGGGGSSTAPTKADYIAKADGICRAARADALPLVKQLTAGGVGAITIHARERAVVARKLHAVEARRLAQLRALDQPKGDSGAIKSFLDPAGQVVTAIDKAAAALGSGNLTGTLALLSEASAAGASAKQAADSYGFKDCGGAMALVAA